MAGEDQQPGGGEEGCLEGVAGEGRLAEAGEGPEAVNQVGGPAGSVLVCPGKIAGEHLSSGQFA